MSANIIPTRKIYDFHGGVHPPENKTQSLSAPLRSAPLPTQVVLPLSMHIGAPAQPLVAVGDRVQTGQMVAAPVGPMSAAIHASISGTVVAIEDRPLAHPSGLPGPCIVIESDGQDQWVETHKIADYRQLPATELVEILRNSGIAGMGGAGFPTAVKLQPKQKITQLILNGTECEPYITADHILMRECADQIVAGAELLAYILGEPETITFAIEDNKPDAIEIMRAAIQKSPLYAANRMEVVSFPTKYPSGGEKQLIEILTGEQVPSGALPASLGIAVQNMGTAVAALEAVTQGKPLIQRITTLVGHALADQGNFWVRIGTPIEHLLEHTQVDSNALFRLVMGGPMMGFSLHDAAAPITKTSNCIIAATQQELPPPPPAQACIRCGLCAEACPAQLLPQQLFWFAQHEDHDKLRNHNLFDCIECGACSYVCPSSIPLVQYYRASKADIRQAEREKIASDHARERFEFRKLRMEREAAEKEAKRKARMAAAKAKAEAKESASEPAADSKPVTPANDLVAAAMARVKDATAKGSESELESLNRQIAAFESRNASLSEKIEAAENDEVKAKFQAQWQNNQAKMAKLETRKLALQQSEPAAPATEPEPAQDAAALAIERAKQKAKAMASMSDSEKLQNTLQSLQTRMQKSQQKLAQAKADGADTQDALQGAVDKLQAKIDSTQAELAKLAPATNTQTQISEAAPAQLDPAAQAIERAKQKAKAMASMSDTEKLQNTLESLQKRLEKSEQKLAQAQAEGADTVDVLASAAEKLRNKIAATAAEIQQLNENG